MLSIIQKSLIFLVLWTLSFHAYGQEAVATSIAPAHDYIFQFEEGFDQNDVEQNIAAIDPAIQTELLSKELNIYRIVLPSSRQKNSASLLAQLDDMPHVMCRQKNHIVTFRAKPNDPSTNRQYYLDKINAYSGWDITTGGQTAKGDDIVIGIIEEGADINHNDLKANIWTNKEEIDNNNIDDDGNGYVDDFYGWSFDTDSDEHQLDGKSHGNIVAGIVGAKGNNGLGITGVNWNVKLAIVSLFDRNLESKVIKAYDYYLKLRKKYNETNGAKGAFVVAINSSFGVVGKAADFPIWCGMYEKMGKVGILNVAATDNRLFDVDTRGDIPTQCPQDLLITVTNSTKLDELDSQAAYGVESIDLAAPGNNIYSLANENAYKSDSGTSFATPQVCGTIGLMYSIFSDKLCEETKRDPEATALEIKKCILNSVTKKASFVNKTKSEGILNVRGCLDCMVEKFKLNSSLAENLGIELSSNNPVDLTNFRVLASVPEGRQAVLVLSDMAGRVITHKDLNGQRSKQTITFEELDLSAGRYNVSLLSGAYKKSIGVLVTHQK